MGSNDVRNHSTSIKLDSQALTRQNRLAFSVYDHQSGLFDDEQYRVLTRVLSLTIDKPALTQHLRSFVKMNFYLKNQFRQNNVSISCAYWRIEDDQTASWSKDGCHLIDYTDENIICECDHLTHFAILMVREIVFDRAFSQLPSFRISGSNLFRKQSNNFSRSLL
jgi:hypothetical protein